MLLFAVPLVALLLLGLVMSVRAKAPAMPTAPLKFGDLVLNTLFFQGAILAGLGCFVRAHAVPLGEAFGLQAGTNARAVLRGAALVAVLLPLTYGLQWLCVRWLGRLGWPNQAQTAVELLLTGAWWQRAYLGCFAVLLAPVAEEGLFRGVFFVCLRDLGHPRLAFWATGIFFGLIHQNAAAFLPLTLFGLALAWLYERTGNLLACITAHALFNLAPFVLLALGLNLEDH